MPQAAQLRVLHQTIALRCQLSVERHPEWPCRRGCDLCCRRLHELPSLTQAEWGFLMQGLVSLAEPLLRELEGRIRRLLPEAATPPFTCPFLDPGTGSCVVYEHRPVACRTYGFYVEREKGLYCEGIEARVARGEMDDVVWGNHGAIEAGLADLGERICAADWFQYRWAELVRHTRPDGP